MGQPVRPGRRLEPLVLAFSIVSLLASAPAASAQNNCLPTCNVTDARFIVVPGGTSAGTFGKNDVSIRLMVPAAAALLQIEVFDGDTGAADLGGERHWDSGSVPLQYDLYADPDGDGTGNALVHSALGSAMPDNAWFTISLPNVVAAQPAPGASFSYTLLVRNPDPDAFTWSGFKVRTLLSNMLSVRPDVFSFLAPLSSLGDAQIMYPDFPQTTPTTYDGRWTFKIDVPNDNARSLTFWDGDLDYGSSECQTRDTDDANTPNKIPAFAAGTNAVAEGVAHAEAGTERCPDNSLPSGNPPDDDFGSSGEFYRREPSVVYQVTDPLGNVYLNTNPSGNREWEEFIVAADDTNQAATADVVAPMSRSLPGGIWTVEVMGMDAGNVQAFKFPFVMVPLNRRSIRVEGLTATAVKAGPKYQITVTPAAGDIVQRYTVMSTSPTDLVIDVSTVEHEIGLFKPLPGWTLNGFTVKADPTGTATCSPAELYTGETVLVPSDEENYLVCIQQTKKK